MVETLRKRRNLPCKNSPQGAVPRVKEADLAPPSPTLLLTKQALRGEGQHVGLGILGFAFGDARIHRPMGTHRYRCVALCRCAGRSWGALPSAVHQPLETRSEAPVSQPAPQHVVKQEHQRDHHHRQRDGQQGEGHRASVTPSMCQLARSTLILLPDCNSLVTYGIPTNIRHSERVAILYALIHRSTWKMNCRKSRLLFGILAALVEGGFSATGELSSRERRAQRRWPKER